MAWIDFLVCLFFGVYGVHKFREKKIGMGILYLFTLGLFGVGWIYDCIRYASVALAPTVAPADEESVDDPQQQKRLFWLMLKKILLWFVVALLIILCLVYAPSVASVLALLAAVLVAPIQKWQDLIGRFVKRGWKTAVIIVLAVATLATAPVDSSLSDGYQDAYQSAIATTTTISSTVTASDEHAVTTEETMRTTDKVTTITKTTTSSKTTTTTKITTITKAATTTTVHIHSFNEATCSLPKICSSCGATEGVANGHDWRSATCDAPQTCVVCGATEGSANGHSYSGGECVSCGSDDPNYVSEEMVWIPTNGGTKYHTHSGCSKMKDPIQVTISEAQARNFGPCGRCYR